MRRLRNIVAAVAASMLAVSCSDWKEGSWVYALKFEYLIDDKEPDPGLMDYIRGKDPYFSTTHSYTGKFMEVRRAAIEEFMVKGKALGDKEISSMLEKNEIFEMSLHQLESPADTTLSDRIAFMVWYPSDLADTTE